MSEIYGTIGEKQVKRATPIAAGSLFVITTGEYSDYTISGVFRALKEIDTEQLLAEWFETNPKQKGLGYFHESEFLAHLTRLGLFETVESREFHFGSHGEDAGMRE